LLNKRADLTIFDSTFTNNHSTGDGGGLWANTGFSVFNGTFSGNAANSYGGGIYISPTQPMTVSNSTFSGNMSNYGGALFVHFSSTGKPGTLTISNCTISGNSALTNGGGIFNYAINPQGVAVFVGNTILKTGTSGENIYNAQGGTLISQGYNLSDDNGGGLLVANGDQPNVNPLLDPAGLQNNGGLTQTIALLPSSPAINTGDPNAPTRDQRYYLRNGPPDKGAFEYGGTLAPLSTVSRKTHGAAGPFDVDLPLSGNAGLECRTGGANSVHQMILNFATPVTVTSASVTSGTGSVSNASVSGSQITVDLTGVSNAQQIALTLSGLSDGANTNDLNVPMRVLLGDTNGNGTVNASDVAQTKGQLGQEVTSSNFRNDVNANGTINASDVSSVKSQIGTSVPVAPQSEITRDAGGDVKPRH
jgi:hypothetical protein